MGAIRNILLPRIGAATRDFSGLDTPRLWLNQIFGGSRTVSGETVTPTTAMSLSAYYDALRIISEDVGKLPLITYRRLPALGDSAKERAPDHPVFPLLRFQPNRDMTSMAWRETMTHWALGWGGGVSEIQRDERGTPIALWPIHPNRIKIGKDAEGVFYDIRMDKSITVRINGQDVPKDIVRLRAENVLHVHGLGPDGINGYSILQFANESIGLGIAVQKFGAAFFGNGTVASGVLTHPDTLDDDALDRLRTQWSEQYDGAEKSHKPIILEEGMVWKQLTIPPNEAQFLETRKFQVTEMSRWFRIPAHKLNDMERSTFSNIDAQNLDYKIDTLDPWLIRWELEILRKLFTPTEQREFFAEHLVAALLRGDTKARGLFYRTQFMIGAITPNEIRAMENRNPSPDPRADQLYVPLNMTPLDSVEGSGHEDDEPDNDDNNNNDDDDEPDVPSEEDMEREREERLRGMAETLRPIFDDAAARVTRKEFMAVGRARKRFEDNNEAFATWVSSFYNEHVVYITEAFQPVVALLQDHANSIMYHRSPPTDGWLKECQARCNRAAFELHATQLAYKEDDEPMCTQALSDCTLDAVLSPYLEHADVTA